MKKLLSIVLLMLSVQVFAQTNPITAITITLPANPDAITANWGMGTSVFVISANSQAVNGHTDPRVEESKMLVRITQNGKTVCGAYTSNNAPDAGFGTLTKVWSGGNAASFLGKDCTLAPGDYELSVQFFGNGAAKPVPLSDEKIKPFTIRGNDQQAYQPPQGIMPADGTAFNETDIKKPITFRWTPVIPKPQEPVTYRLNVWQLMKGQTGPQATKANIPIITKDVENLTQAVIPNLVNGPCQLPYLCSFVWNVQALGRDGKPIGSNDGKSNTNGFVFNQKSLNPGSIADTLTVTCNGYGKYNYTLKARNNGTEQFVATSFTLVSPGGSITNITSTPTLPTNINSGALVTFTGSFNYTGTVYPTIVIGDLFGHDVSTPLLHRDESDSDSLKACMCNDCKGSAINFTNFHAAADANNNGQMDITGNISVSGLPAVYGMELQVQSYDYTAAPAACTNGVTAIAQSGMFLKPGTSINGVSAIQFFNETISGDPNTNNNAAKTIKYISTSQLPNSVPVSLAIGLPGPITGLSRDCCKINYNLCITVTVFYDKDGCRSCVFNYCFPSFSN